MLALLQRCDGIETEVKKVGELKDVRQTTLYTNYFYKCPLCGYSAVDVQPEGSNWHPEQK